MTNPTTRTLGKDEWMTPDEVFDPVHRELRFEFDAAAGSERESRLPQFIDPVTDALGCSWRLWGKRAWLNPPYGRDLGKWFAKATQQVKDGVHLVCMLTYANTDTKYWQRYVVENPYCHEVIFLTPRVRFVDPDDTNKSNGAPKGSALIIFRSSFCASLPRHTYWSYKRDPFRAPSPRSNND